MSTPSSDRAERKNRIALQTVGAVIAFGAAASAIYGFACANPSRTDSLLYLGILLAGVLSGGLIGFLFGLPRFKFDTPAAAAAPAAGTVTATANQVAAAGTTNADGARYRPSTNLDDVADWLTKIIVGVTLVQLKDIGVALQNIAAYLAPPNKTCGKPEAFVATIIVLAVVAGFLFGYIWTRLNYGALAAQSDIDIQKLLRDKEQSSEANVGVGKDPNATNTTIAASSKVAGERGDEVDDDPNKAKFGTRPVANGRALRAVIEPSTTRPGWCRITLTVSSTDPAKPLTGNVAFHLHPTFDKPIVNVPVQNAVATLTIVAYGAFTVGAEADDGKTRLGLDLARNPDAPDDFKAR